MKKKFLAILCTTVMLIFSCIPAYANQNIKVLVDDYQVSFDVPPQLIGGRTMVPLRAIFEALGAAVEWDDSTRTITAYNEAYLVKCTIGENEMIVNNEKVAIDVPPMIVNDRTLVPARFVSEAFNCDVSWDADTRTVFIKTKPIDYNNIEKGSGDTPNDSHRDDTILYYPNTVVPDYTYVTGIELMDTTEFDDGGMLYAYENTKFGEYSEMVD